MFFPYSYGAAFLQKIWAQNPSWESVNKMYSDLPSSTEQIIHPEKYFVTRDEPKPVSAEALAARLGSDWKVAYKNVLGEFSLNLLLSLHLSEERSRRSAAGWGGDQVLLLENSAGQKCGPGRDGLGYRRRKRRSSFKPCRHGFSRNFRMRANRMKPPPDFH